MYLNAYAVSERMSEILAEACIVNDISRYLIKLFTCYACFNCVYACKLSFKHDIIHLFHLICRLADTDGSCHIAMIAVNYSTEIKQHEIAALYLFIRRHSMRK